MGKVIRKALVRWLHRFWQTLPEQTQIIIYAGLTARGQEAYQLRQVIVDTKRKKKSLPQRFACGHEVNQTFSTEPEIA